MRWLFLPAVAVLSFGIATPVLSAQNSGTAQTAAPSTVQTAQYSGHDRDRDRDRDRRSAPRRDTQSPRNQQNYQRPQYQHRQMQQPQYQRHQMQQPQYQRPYGTHSQRYDWRNYQTGRRPPDWQRHRDFDRNAWQRNWRSQQRYHWRNYDRPRGWYYRRWAYGMILPSLFWGRQYWIDGYYNFGLPDPPYGYVWVRNGDDALLVNVETGYVLQVRYGIFY